MRTILIPICLLAACTRAQDTNIEPIDVDADGFSADADCNDADPNVHPGAVELCDGVDQDCDGSTDDNPSDGTDWYLDADGDGYGNAAFSANECAAPAGHVADATDCDDTAADIHPGAAETSCTDPTDYNCDGSVGFEDADGDGHAACNDCDDSIAAINADADETCDGIDNDCNGVADEAGAIGEHTCYNDLDGDGYGNLADAVTQCDCPAGYVNNSTDCNDSSAAALPGGIEVCDGLDNDCFGGADNNVAGAPTWYADGDGDSFGNRSVSIGACDAPTGFVSDDTDCDDGDGASYPGASEVCDDADNDCNGVVDNGVIVDWYYDGDSDGYGDAGNVIPGCSAPNSWYVAAGDDCNDDDASVNPGEAPGCDGIDHDCDGAIDNDADLDGWSDISCGGLDCRDDDAAIVPEAGGGCALGASCLEIQQAGLGSTDGVYHIDPDGAGGPIPDTDVWCDMTSDGGGWTLVLVTGGGTGHTWSTAQQGQMGNLRPSPLPATDQHIKFSDDVMNAIKDGSRGDEIGIRMIESQTYGTVKFGKASCTLGCSYADANDADCVWGTGTYAISPAWTDLSDTNDWKYYVGAANFGPTRGFERMSLYCRNNAGFHYGWVGDYLGGTMWVK